MSKIKLMSHLVAGYPTDGLALAAARALIKGGADILEIQLPFSDPSADGPAIQTACTTVLERGYRTADGLRFIGTIHAEFPDTPIYTLPISIIVRNEQSVGENFFTALESSFEKTLIREDRYKMILDGLRVTLILSLGAIILGTILGFVFCMIKRSKIFLLSTIMTAFIALISGLPIVLTLMICFYVINPTPKGGGLQLA